MAVRTVQEHNDHKDDGEEEIGLTHFLLNPDNATSDTKRSYELLARGRSTYYFFTHYTSTYMQWSNRFDRILHSDIG